MEKTVGNLKMSLEREIKEICEKTKSNMSFCDAKALYYLTEAYCNVKSMAEYEEEKPVYNTAREYKEREHKYAPMDTTTAMHWVKGMENTDGSRGGHWNINQTNAVLQSSGIKNISQPLFYAVMNMLYSDYGEVAKKYSLDTNVNFWVDMTKAWLFDEDAKPEKTSLYYSYVVNK